MIEVSDLSYTYKGKNVLKRARFKVGNGKIYGIFGAHGAGKSTLLSLMAGTQPIGDGYIRVNGFDLAKEPVAAKRCIGYLPQDPVFYGDMTVFELLDFVAEARGVRDDRRFIHVHEKIEAFGMDNLRDKRIAYLEWHELRRFGILQAVIGDPEILLLDSPTEGLRTAEAKELRELIREVAEKGKTVFLASSSPSEILDLCSEVFLIANGVLEAPAPIGELLDGSYLTLCVKGNREGVQAALSGVEGLLSCRLTAHDGESLTFRLKALGVNAPSEVRMALSRAGLEVEAVEEEQPGDAEAALRRASKGLSSANRDEALSAYDEGEVNDDSEEVDEA